MNSKDLRGQHDEWDGRSRAAQAAAAQSFDRLVGLAETSASDQVERVARFVASAYDGEVFPIDLFMLRTFDFAISDDMLICIDALRWGKATRASSFLTARNVFAARSLCGASNGRQRIEGAHHTDALGERKTGR